MNKETILLVLILFLPVVHFEIYLVAIFTFSLLMILINNEKIQINSIYQASIFVVPLIIYLLIKLLLFESIDDYKEFLKLIVFGIVFYSFKNIKLEQVEKVLFAYIIIDFILTLFQFFKIDFLLFDFISTMYNSSGHIAGLDYNSVRALGLSPGPGQHGVMGLFVFTFFITLIVFYRFSFLRLFSLIFSFLIIVFSQSKTSFVVLFFVLILVMVFSLWSNRKSTKLTLFLFMSLFFGTLFLFLDDLLLFFRQYEKLIELGLGASSFQARIDKWNEMMIPIFDEPILFLFGAGRSYLDFINVKNSVFDSDYIYVFINYGFIVFCILSLWLLYFISKSAIHFKRINIESKILLFILLSGLVSAISINFFFDIKILLLLSILLHLNSKEKNEKCFNNLY